MTNKLKIIIAGCVMAIGILGQGIFYYVQRQIDKPFDATGQEKTFIIEKGERSRDIAKRLESEGIASDFYFQFYIWQKGWTNKLQTGEFSLSGKMTIPEIAQKIYKGQTSDIKLTFPEGMTLAQMSEKLNQAGLLKNNELVSYWPDADRYQILSVSAKKNLEGYLFPDTYRFNKYATTSEIVAIFLINLNDKLSSQIRSDIKKQNKTIFEVLTLASIVQAEAADEEEMPQIASVFLNRLSIGMALQSDATVNYATGKKSRQISNEDKKITSPYNTYKYVGLTPGPINNPGLAAIKAVIYPAETNYLYFLHPLNQKAIFAKTAKEHEVNQVKYLR